MINHDSPTSILQALEQAATLGQLPLAQQAADIVMGEGDENAEIMLIGEAPGYHESVQRRPFVGVSGKLLRKTLEEVGILPATVYISNIVKVRPPDNRDPSPEEIAAFKPYLDREIMMVQPKLIITLGRFSMAKFLPGVFISQVHGRLHKVVWEDKPHYVLPMYHPAAALRSGNMKAAFLADFQKVPKILSWLTDQASSHQAVEEVKAALL
jgi:uracil-DNA glycosylase